MIRAIPQPLVSPLVGPLTGKTDTDLAAYIAATGATDTAGLANLVAYLKAQSLFASSRFFSMKAAQNFGSGSTVRGLGGLGTADITLASPPTWGASGIALGATQYMHATISAIGSASEGMIFARVAPTLASVADAGNMIATQIGNYRNTTPTGTAGITLGSATSAFAGEVSAAVFTLDADTSDVGRRLGTTGGTWTAGENFTRVYSIGSAGFAQWKNKTTTTIDLEAVITSSFPCGPTALGTTGGNIAIGGQRTNGTLSAFGGRGTVTAYLFIAGSAQPTLAQREAITDLINAL